MTLSQAGERTRFPMKTHSGKSVIYDEPNEGCTVGCAMGAGVPDGRPFCWKNRDMSQHANCILTDDTGKYTFIGQGTTYMMSGINEAGLAVGNSYVTNMDTGGSCNNYGIQVWILANCATVGEVRKAIIEDTTGSQDHWRSPGGCFVVCDAGGRASLFEVGTREFFEYNPRNSNRLEQFPRQFCVRANVAHKNMDHRDDEDTGGNRYVEARDHTDQAALSGKGITVPEFINDICRFGEPGYTPRQNCGANTCNASIVWGAAQGEDGKTATLFASCGQPDYCCFIPVWVANYDSYSPRITSRDADGLAHLSWELYSKRDDNDYDQYINSFFTGMEDNFYQAVVMARDYWNQREFKGSWAHRITDEAAETAWTTMNVMNAGSGRNLNKTPRLMNIECFTSGTQGIFQCYANDPDGSIASVSWDFGDGYSYSGTTATHAYEINGVHLVRCRVTDNRGSRNSCWKTVNITQASDGVIVDNQDPGFSTTGGARMESPSTDELFHSSYYTPGIGVTASWTPKLPRSGMYRVYAWWSNKKAGGGSYDRDHSAEYRIHHRSGISTVTKNQNQDGGEWILLGKYVFESGESGKVSLTRENDGQEGEAISFDAIKWALEKPYGNTAWMLY